VEEGVEGEVGEVARDTVGGGAGGVMGPAAEQWRLVSDKVETH
jgi:hypothetical protein